MKSVFYRRIELRRTNDEQATGMPGVGSNLFSNSVHHDYIST